MRVAPGGEPDRQRSAIRARHNKCVVQRRTKFTLPGDFFAFVDLQKQFKFFGIKLVIVVEIMSEKRKGFC
ncbi:hypothetical protein D3C81_2070420 [compost metagenome]